MSSDFSAPFATPVPFHFCLLSILHESGKDPAVNELMVSITFVKHISFFLSSQVTCTVYQYGQNLATSTLAVYILSKLIWYKKAKKKEASKLIGSVSGLNCTSRRQAILSFASTAPN